MKLAVALFVGPDEPFASLSANCALCGAHLHGGIVAKPLALGPAQLARYGTCPTHLDVKWTAARHHLGCNGTEVGAVSAGFGGCQVVRLAVPEHLQAIGGAVVARALAIGASPRDLQQSEASVGIAKPGITKASIATASITKAGIPTTDVALAGSPLMLG
jgi:hypothetical protein